jgi:type I restriction enzyme M protein
LWILNNNKKARTIEQNGKVVHYRNRENEVLFIDLRLWGEPFEKKYNQFPFKQIQQVAQNFHNWQREGYKGTYHDVAGYCYSASIEEIEAKGWSLVPSKYIEFKGTAEEIDFDNKMMRIQSELHDLLAKEEDSKKELKALFEKLGYGI